MPGGGLEPPRPCGQRLLRPPRLPIPPSGPGASVVVAARVALVAWLAHGWIRRSPGSPPAPAVGPRTRLGRKNRSGCRGALVDERDRDLRGLLATIPMFAELSPKDLELALSRCRTIHLEAGQLCVREGDPSDALYVVINGRLQAVGEEDPRREISRGQVLGEIGMLTGQRRTASVRAVRDSELLVLPRGEFDRLAHENPQWLRHVARIVVDRFVPSQSPSLDVERVLTLGLFGLGESSPVSEVCRGTARGAAQRRPGGLGIGARRGEPSGAARLGPPPRELASLCPLRRQLGRGGMAPLVPQSERPRRTRRRRPGQARGVASRPGRRGPLPCRSRDGVDPAGTPGLEPVARGRRGVVGKGAGRSTPQHPASPGAGHGESRTLADGPRMRARPGRRWATRLRPPRRDARARRGGSPRGRRGRYEHRRDHGSPARLRHRRCRPPELGDVRRSSRAVTSSPRRSRFSRSARLARSGDCSRGRAGSAIGPSRRAGCPTSASRPTSPGPRWWCTIEACSPMRFAPASRCPGSSLRSGGETICSWTGASSTTSPST